jgi:enoyl-CoA hydratase
MTLMSPLPPKPSPDVRIRAQGRAGRITLTRPQALNALTWDMCLAIEGALDWWQENPDIDLVLIDAEGERAFCAGGDLAQMYQAGRDGQFGYGARFWRDEYRLNAAIRAYPKPVVTLMQGFTMGGGVGIGCHASHRVVGDTSLIALPECGIGLVPDCGSSLLLALAPGHLGEYIGLTGARLGPGAALHAGLADIYLPEPLWPAAIATLCDTGDPLTLITHSPLMPFTALTRDEDSISTVFAATTAPDILTALSAATGDWAPPALAALSAASPLSVLCTLDIIRTLRAAPDMASALDHEYRFTARSLEHGDFLEGIRAQIIDRDRRPHWRHAGLGVVPPADIARMRAPLPQEQDQ